MKNENYFRRKFMNKNDSTESDLNKINNVVTKIVEIADVKQ